MLLDDENAVSKSLVLTNTFFNQWLPGEWSTVLEWILHFQIPIAAPQPPEVYHYQWFIWLVSVITLSCELVVACVYSQVSDDTIGKDKQFCPGCNTYVGGFVRLRPSHATCPLSVHVTELSPSYIFHSMTPWHCRTFTLSLFRRPSVFHVSVFMAC